MLTCRLDPYKPIVSSQHLHDRGNTPPPPRPESQQSATIKHTITWRLPTWSPSHAKRTTHSGQARNKSGFQCKCRKIATCCADTFALYSAACMYPGRQSSESDVHLLPTDDRHTLCDLPSPGGPRGYQLKLRGLTKNLLRGQKHNITPDTALHTLEISTLESAHYCWCNSTLPTSTTNASCHHGHSYLCVKHVRLSPISHVHLFNVQQRACLVSLYRDKRWRRCKGAPIGLKPQAPDCIGSRVTHHSLQTQARRPRQLTPTPRTPSFLLLWTREYHTTDAPSDARHTAWSTCHRLEQQARCPL